jgi:O-antigen ligase
VVKQLITTKEHLQTVLTILMIVSLVMSVLGIVEYQFPGVETSWPWLFTGHALDTQEGFHRAAFSFFGYPAAATFVAWGMVISYDRFFNRRDRLQQVFATVVFLLGGWAVYISGQRSSWLGVGLALTVLSIPFGIRGVGVVVMVWGAITQFSRVFWNRVDTVTVYLQRGIVQDTSTEQRINRASWAWDTIFEKPLIGGGYGHWLAHNVFLEIGSTIGVIPALAFMVFIAQLLFRIIGTISRGASVEQRRYGWLFLSLTVLWILQMSVETIFQTPPFAAAHWAMMAVAWNLRDICAGTSPAREPLVHGPMRNRGLIHDYSLNPNLQL